MHLNISRGPAATGKTVRLRQIAEANGQGTDRILVGRHATTDLLERAIRTHIARGATVICIDDCTEEQITRLERLQKLLPDALTIHAVVAN
ncbi:MAG: hypothetical protein GAK45_00107 [Pseudomonas citronellolis]|nr:MAG: hypothetical protein GAK45_00107 [Pseudomonas citronellolis]